VSKLTLNSAIPLARGLAGPAQQGAEVVSSDGQTVGQRL
jgi:hypothetical protein